jgi:phospholipid/cholesterol/gamma-HCH transport system ATP-binding protein
VSEQATARRPASTTERTLVTVRHVVMEFDQKRVLDGIDLDVVRGEILAIVGGSGSGKSTLLRLMSMLIQPTSGSIDVFGTDVARIDDATALPLRKRIGVMFQNGGLFGDMNVLENVGVPLREHTHLDATTIDELAQLRIALVGLDADAATKMPSQLSGGMRKRASLARAMALDPDVLFLDEPTSGLDPISSDAIDELVLELKQSLGLTIVTVTHDMDSLWRIADRVALLADGRVAVEGSMHELAESPHPVAREFFGGARGRASQHAEEHR